MASDPLKQVMLRNNFYRDNYRRVVAILLIAVLIIVALCGIVFYEVTHRPEPVYFATNRDGTILRLVPLNQPNLTTEVILQWATNAATASYTYNFAEYRQQLQNIKQYYTRQGYEAFLNVLKTSGNLATLENQRLIATAVVTRAPYIISEGLVRGQRYAWKVSLDLLVNYQSASRRYSEPMVVTLLITRVSTLDSPKGIGIEQFVASRGS